MVIMGPPFREMKRPNIVFVLCDDLGYGDVSALNPGSRVQTPVIDGIRSNGICFADAHASSAVCSPSRYSLLTGRYDFRSRLKEGVLYGYSNALIESGRLTVAGLLKSAGYRTAMVGKWHLGMHWKCKDGLYSNEGGRINEKAVDCNVDFTAPVKDGPIANGFDYFYGISASLDMPPYVYIENDGAVAVPEGQDFSGFAGNINGASVVQGDSAAAKGLPGPVQKGLQPDRVLGDLTDKAVEVIRAASGGDCPFFLYFPITAPHTPVAPSREFVGRSGTGDQYLDFVVEIDHCMGRLMAALEQGGVRDDTLFIFTSDNGPERFMHERKKKTGHYSAAQFRGCKRDNWDGGHRVPLIAQWPGRIKPGSTVSETVCLADFFATAAEIAGVGVPEEAAEDSFSFLPQLTGIPSGAPLRELTVHHSSKGDFAIRRGEWKLLLHAGSGGNRYDDFQDPSPIQLYRITDDEGENRNVWKENPGVVRELAGLFFDILEKGRSTPGMACPNHGCDNSWTQVKKALAALKEAGVDPCPDR